MAKLRILIADDHEIIRYCVRETLAQQQGWEVCGEAVDGRDALEKTRSLKPDVIVLDFRMPHLNGLEVAEAIKVELPEAFILILSQNDPRDILSRETAGVVGAAISKNDLQSALVPAIERLVANGD